MKEVLVLLCLEDLRSVELFLNTVKREVKKGNRKFIYNRKVIYDGKVVSAKQALLDLGIVKEKQIWDYIVKLEACECKKIERERDFHRDYNDEMYIFESLINEIRTYIKLTINNHGVVCLSFHKCRY